MPGARRLALTGSAAGVVIVAVGVAVLANSGGQDGANAPHGHLSAAAAAVPTATAGSNADVRGVAAYPPRTPCSLSLFRTSTGSDDLSIEGSGLGPAQTVTVVYSPGTNVDATTLGTWHTDQGGSFDGPVQVPDTDGYVTARTQSVQCSTPAGTATDPDYPPTTGTAGPTTSSGPTTGPTTGPVTSTSSGPSTGSSTSAGPTTTSSAGVSAGSSGAAGPSGSSSTAGASSPGATSSSGASSSGAPSSGSGSSGNGPSNSTSGAVAPNSSAPTSSTPSPTTTPAAISAQSWGLSTSFLVTMILVLLVLGGLAVLVLTRRAS